MAPFGRNRALAFHAAVPGSSISNERKIRKTDPDVIKVEDLHVWVMGMSESDSGSIAFVRNDVFYNICVIPNNYHPPIIENFTYGRKAANSNPYPIFAINCKRVVFLRVKPLRER